MSVRESSFKHETTTNIQQFVEGIDLFDDERRNMVTIYRRYKDGRSGCRDVGLGANPEFVRSVLSAWCTGMDVRDFRNSQNPVIQSAKSCVSLVWQL